jgi:hypothetical protein
VDGTRFYMIQALDGEMRVVGRTRVRARSLDEAWRWAAPLLRWQVGAVTLADAGWRMTRVFRFSYAVGAGAGAGSGAGSVLGAGVGGGARRVRIGRTGGVA